MHRAIYALKILASYKAKNSKNQQPLDILAYNSANKPSFRNPTKNLFAQRSIDVNHPDCNK